MKMLKKMIPVILTMLLMLTAAVPAFGQVITYKSNNVSSTVSEKETADNTKYGPGYVTSKTEVEIVEETVASVPEVKKVDLKETYHELYDVYEESIAGEFFIYANVANGGLTHEPVVIDIPTNIIYTMEKDGVPHAYQSKTQIAPKGTYVLRLTAVANPERPFSEQSEYQSVFRFRIEDEPPVQETEAESLAADSAIVIAPAETMIDVSMLFDETTESLKESETMIESTESVQVEDSFVDFAEESKAAIETEAAPETDISTEAAVEEETTIEAANSQAVQDSETTETEAYQINMYGILAIVLVILVIVGIAVFVLLTKKNLTVR